MKVKLALGVVLALVVAGATCAGSTVAFTMWLFASRHREPAAMAPGPRQKVPGRPGWSPSGRGVEIPEARLVDGRPQGLWWRFSTTDFTKIMLCLPDGTLATDPLPGGGTLFDLEAQRTRGVLGVGTFALEDGKFVRRHGGHSYTDPFESGSDADGEWIKLGDARWVPLRFVGPKELAGTWQASSKEYLFRDDHTYAIRSSGELVPRTHEQGTWTIDGYLLSATPEGAPAWSGPVARWGSLLLINHSVYSRVAD